MSDKNNIIKSVRREEDIFELLKDIKEAETNNQLIAYFDFVKFYGLLDRNTKNKFEEVNNKQNKMLKLTFSGYGLTLLASYIFYKRNYSKLACYIMIIGVIPTRYLQYLYNQEINFDLLQMKDSYIFQIDNFFKGENNPIILNSDLATKVRPDQGRI